MPIGQRSYFSIVAVTLHYLGQPVNILRHAPNGLDNECASHFAGDRQGSQQHFSDLRSPRNSRLLCDLLSGFRSAMCLMTAEIDDIAAAEATESAQLERDDDQVLAVRFREGDATAFDDIVATYSKRPKGR